MRSIIAIISCLIFTFSHAEPISVGTPPYVPPFVMPADNRGHLTGFSVEIMSSICKYIQADCHFQTMTFTDTFDQVMNNQIAVAVGNIIITKEREQYVLFSLPYLHSEGQFIGLKTSHISTLSDLNGKTIGAEQGAIFGDYIQQQFGPETKLINYKVITDMMAALTNGDVDALILNKQTAESLISNDMGEFKPIDKPFPIGLGLGIMANKDNANLISRINKALLMMESDGTYLKIYNTYFGSELSPNPSV